MALVSKEGMATMQILEQGEYVGFIHHEVKGNGMLASVSTYDQELFNHEWHCHVNPHISFVLKGGCSERKKNAYERLAGKATFYMGGEPHQILTMSNSTHINLEFEASFLQRFGLSGELFGKAMQQSPDGKLMMLQVYKELLEDDGFTATSVEMLLLRFLEQAKRWQEHTMPTWIHTVHELLEDRWNETLRLDDLARAAGVHPGTVSHYFPKYFSSTLGVYMRKLKVEKALSLVKAGKTSLTDISYECGFFDQSHFIRTFKQLTGFLPSEYQQL